MSWSLVVQHTGMSVTDDTCVRLPLFQTDARVLRVAFVSVNILNQCRGGLIDGQRLILNFGIPSGVFRLIFEKICGKFVPISMNIVVF